MQVEMNGQIYAIELIKHSRLGGKQYPIYKLTGPKAIYYTLPYVNHPGKHFILDSKGKCSQYMRSYTFCVSETGQVSVI